jgi:hypothetical protein
MQNPYFVNDPTILCSELTQMKLYWLSSMKTLDILFNKVCNIDSKSATAFRKLLSTRQQIKSELARVINEIKKLDELRQALCLAEEKKFQANNDIEKYKHFKQSKTILTFVQEDTMHHNTLCMKHKSNCHEHCSLQETTSAGAQIFSGCNAMDAAGMCILCAKNNELV